MLAATKARGTTLTTKSEQSYSLRKHHRPQESTFDVVVASGIRPAFPETFAAIHATL